MRIILLLCAVVCGAAPTAALSAEDDAGAWLTAAITGPLGGADAQSSWRYLVDVQYRYLDADNNVGQFVLRPSAGLRLGGSLEAWVGYARFENNRQRGASSHENRLWQQLNWKAGDWLGGGVTMRARLEERSVSTGDDLGIVLRYMVRYTRPFAQRDDRFLTAYVEPFVDLRDTDWGAESGLSQSRVSVGFGQRFNPRSVIEYGYMHQYFYRDQTSDRNNHIATVSFRHSF